MVVMQGLKEKSKMFVIYVVVAKKMAKSFKVDELVISQYILGLQKFFIPRWNPRLKSARFN